MVQTTKERLDTRIDTFHSFLLALNGKPIDGEHIHYLMEAYTEQAR